MRSAFDATTLGVPRGAVDLVPADPTWAKAYERALPLLRGALAGLAVAIEHIGSTAIPGLPAKPILDIAVGVPPGRDPTEVDEPLVGLGFVYRGADDSRTTYGWESEPRVRVVNLHVVEHEGRTWRAYVAFRDALRANPEARDAYAALKQELADRFPPTEPPTSPARRPSWRGCWPVVELGDRIHVIGGGGSGKTTLARRLAAARGLPLWELDRQGSMEEVAAQARWVMEGIFLFHVEVAFERATTIIWLDLPPALATRRIVARHVKLSLLRKNPHPGLRNLARFVADQREYYTREPRLPESATDWGALSRTATERALEPFRGKVIHLATPGEVRRFSRRTGGTGGP